LARNPLARQAHQDATVVVIGLGRFGAAVATSLVRMGMDVLAVDSRADLVARYADELTHVVQADSTDDEALSQLDLQDFPHAIVAIGSDIEASVLTTLNLVQLGLQDIWAKAITAKHGAILEHIGAHHVVYPEREMGEKVSHLIMGTMTQYMEFEDGYVIARTFAPQEAWGRTLAESALRSKYDVTIVGLKRSGETFTHASPETVVQRYDELIVSGQTRTVEQFCALP
jgi:trk system potassium uptake protein TrkA